MRTFKAYFVGEETVIGSAHDALSRRMHDSRAYENGQLEDLVSDTAVLMSVVANLLDAQCTTPRELLDMCNLQHYEVREIEE